MYCGRPFAVTSRSEIASQIQILISRFCGSFRKETFKSKYSSFAKSCLKQNVFANHLFYGNSEPITLYALFHRQCQLFLRVHFVPAVVESVESQKTDVDIHSSFQIFAVCSKPEACVQGCHPIAEFAFEFDELHLVHVGVQLKFRRCMLASELFYLTSG